MKNNTSSLCANYKKEVKKQAGFFKNWTLKEVCNFFGVKEDLHESKEDVIYWVNLLNK